MTTRRLNPVAWTEGLFLRPHHLQQHELFNEERLRCHLRTLNPFHWGVRELEIDEEALSDHQLVILRLDAVLPGGIIVRHPGNAMVESREFEPASERIDVHVGIRHLSATEANTARHGDGVRDVRFLIDAHELPDVALGGAAATIELAHPNVRIFLSGEENALEQYENFKLAEIVATGELKRPFSLSPTYVPPLLAVEGASILHDDVMKIVSQIAAKMRVVAGRTSTIAIADLPRMWVRYTLARLTPVFRHLLSTGETRPFHLYTLLTEAAGSLSTFNYSEPVELPLYDHEDLYACFHALIQFIDAELERVIPDRFKRLKLNFDASQNLYATKELNVQLVDPRNAFYLATKAPIDSQQLIELVVSHGKASSQSGVPPLEMLKVTGLRIEHLPGAPTDIGAEAGFEYFKVDPHGPHWSKVREEFSFALSLGKLENADAWLYVVTIEE
jgi:type VI secretion system protein ImpJ